MKTWIVAVLMVALGCGGTAAFFMLRHPGGGAAAVAEGASPKAEQPGAKNEHRGMVALVIGNGSYAEAPLDNPVNDSKLVARALRDFGFFVVERQNLSQNELRQAVREFGDALQRGGSAVFYYAGHGIQHKGRNFLIPVSADIRHEDEIEDQGVDVNLVLAKMDSAKSRINLVILDACRNNPFTKAFSANAAGLAPIDAPSNTLVAFATAPGQVAEDGSGGNGLYTRHLVENMRQPGISIEDVFKRTRVAVRTESEGRQVPWENTSLEENFAFLPAQSAPTAIAAAPAAAPAPQAAPAAVAAAPEPPVQAPAARPEPAPKAAPVAAEKQEPMRVAAAPAATTVRAVSRDAATDELVSAYRRQDYALAFRLASTAAERGNALAQYYLAEMYRLGRGVESGPLEALKWYRRAGEQGNVNAQEWLGRSYSSGLGVQRDYEEAIKWFRRAADQGSAVGQNGLGSMYRSGQGVPQNTAEAVKWYELAAAQGNPEAQYNLQMTRAQQH